MEYVDMSLKIKRVYDAVEKSDGIRILVDRLWPRGLSKESAHIDEWLKNIAPSNELRKWFNHQPERWQEFRKRYRKELQSPEGEEALRRLKSLAGNKTVTLLFGAKDVGHNNAMALSQFLLRRS